MRVGFVRSDISHLYLNDIENRSQRAFSMEPAGQSRYFHQPTSAEITTTLNTYAFLSVLATDVAATVDTSVNNTLRIRKLAADAFSIIAVPAGVATAKTGIRDSLNLSFINLGLPFVASITAPNKLQIDTAGTNAGPTARMEIDSVANGSTLNTAVGFPVGVTIVSGISAATLIATVYPTSVTINVSTAAITALSTFVLLSATKQTNLVNGIANTIAPQLVESGPVLLSFVYGVISKLRSATFQPGGTRSGLPAGIAAAVVQNDGVTVYTV
jgi:hypothetical protein